MFKFFEKNKNLNSYCNHNLTCLPQLSDEQKMESKYKYEEGKPLHYIYIVQPKNHFAGMSLICADSPDEANQFIQEHIDKFNDSTKYDYKGYQLVDESDVVPKVYGEVKGIIYEGIFYYG